MLGNRHSEAKFLNGARNKVLNLFFLNNQSQFQRKNEDSAENPPNEENLVNYEFFFYVNSFN